MTYRILSIAVVLLGVLACDDASVPLAGIQIGSEGILGTCETRSTTDDETLEGFTLDNMTLATTFAGNWSLVLREPDVEATLSVAVLESSAVVEGEGCPPGLLLSVDAPMQADLLVNAPFGGFLLVGRDDQARMLLNTASPSGDLQPGGDVELRERVDLVLDAELGADNLSGDLFFLGCDGTECVDENVSGVTGTR